MSWRFRKSFKVIPGVRLNLTARGLSATFGAAPFSANVGPRGVYRNVSIPGTGIWDRQRIDFPSSQSSSEHFHPSAPAAVPPSYPVSPSPGSEIHSASTEMLTSESLDHLRKLLTDTYNERNELTTEISVTDWEAKNATKRYHKWERGFLFKNIFKQSFATRKATTETATAKLEELREQLRLTTVATDIGIDQEQAEPYFRMRDKFAALSESKTMWNVLAEQAIDRVAARSHASSEVTRTPVSFSLGVCDLIQWEQKVPHLPNRTGGDMYLYPGFILYRESKQAFALIDFRDVMLRFVSTRFTERDPIPSDSQIVGYTWAKCNKDGTRDRRFRDNYQIPLAHYGELLFSTRDGLDVRYICSNPKSAEDFVKAWAAFQMSFHGGQEKPDVPVLASSNEYVNTLLERSAHAVARLERASENFQVEHEKFTNITNKLSEIARQHPSESACQLTISAEEFEAYTSSVGELIAAAKELEQNAIIVSNAARDKFRIIIQWTEAKWAAFSSVADGQLNGNAFVPFFNSVAEFLNARNEFMLDLVMTSSWITTRIEPLTP